MSGQKKSHSALESIVNVLVGYSIGVASQVIIFPWFGIHASISQNLAIAGLFTVVSLVRSYALRRLFNIWQIKTAQSNKG